LVSLLIRGANTNQCSGDLYELDDRCPANNLRTFYSTFGILLGATLALVGLLGAFSDKVAQRQSSSPLQQDLDEHDYHKIAMVGNNRNLVDF
jgi:hypothetical protein